MNIESLFQLLMMINGTLIENSLSSSMIATVTNSLLEKIEKQESPLLMMTSPVILLSRRKTVQLRSVLTPRLLQSNYLEQMDVMVLSPFSIKQFALVKMLKMHNLEETTLMLKRRFHLKLMSLKLILILRFLKEKICLIKMETLRKEMKPSVSN